MDNRKRDASLPQEPRQGLFAEADRIDAREGFGISAEFVEGQPEVVAGQAQAGGHAGLDEQVLESPSPHEQMWLWRGPCVMARLGRIGLLLLLPSLLLGGCARPAADPSELPEPVLASLVARVERARGLRFTRPVDARTLLAAQVPGVLEAQLSAVYGPGFFARDAALKVAVGLLPAGTDVRSSWLALQSEVVAGFYSPLLRRLYVVVPPGSAQPLLDGSGQAIAVHELVHALQDAHFDLLQVAMGLVEHDDVAFAIGALAEGDALRTAFVDHELREETAPPDPVRFAATFAQGWSGDEEQPRWVVRSLLEQYPLGYALADSLAAAGGNGALDAAFRDPPLTSSALLHPERYLRGRGPRLAKPDLRALPDPGPGCERVTANGFGELGVRVWLQEHDVMADASSIADGWKGDRAVVWRCAQGQAFVWRIDFDTDAAAARFQAVAWLSAGGLEVTRQGHRVLLFGAVGEATRQAALDAPLRRFADLAEFLAAHPEIRERAAELRARAAAQPLP